MTQSDKGRAMNNFEQSKKIENSLIDEAQKCELSVCAEDVEDSISAITFVDQRKILKALEDPKYKNFFYFCCCTGVRVCEALNIKVADINKRRKIIKITLCDSKTKKHQRNIPYLPELFEKMDLKREYLFEDITDEGSKKYFYNLYKKLELDLSRHSTRHTFVSVCSHIGIAAATIQGWVGHTDLKMTINTYTHKLERGTSPVLAYLRKLKKDVKLRQVKK